MGEVSHAAYYYKTFLKVLDSLSEPLKQKGEMSHAANHYKISDGFTQQTTIKHGSHAENHYKTCEK